jgi:hypothetical protein
LKQTRGYQRQFQSSYVAQFRRLLRLYVRDQYGSQEISILGIADPHIPEAELQRYISKRALLKIQYSLNDARYLSLTEDKTIFYAVCDSFQIPSPKVYAVFSAREGWLADGSFLRGRDQWVDYLERAAPREFIIKPGFGVYGRGLKMLERQDRRWLCKSGLSYDSRELYECLASDPDFDRFVLQERVRNHDDFSWVSRTEALQTARITTLMKRNREPQIIYTQFKIVKGNNITDNFASGETGNLLARLDVATGKVVAVVGKQNGSLRSITRDEQTGINYLDFTLPLWAEAKKLALQAAMKFWPIQTIGWDIAITQSGPVLIEGNQCWDPMQNLFKENHIFREHLSQIVPSS